MFENPLKEVLVKKAFFENISEALRRRRAEREKREALINKYLPIILDPSQPIPDEIKPILQEAIGDREIDDWKAWNTGFKGHTGGDAGRLWAAYRKRMLAKYDGSGNLKVPTKELSAPSVTPANPSMSAPAASPAALATPTATPIQNPLGNAVINLADYNKPHSLDDVKAIVAQGIDGKPIATTGTGVTNSIAPAPTPSPAPAGQVSAADSKTVKTTAPAVAQPPARPAQTTKTKTPAGLTREETMQFLQQGYVPTRNGGYILDEQQAANMLQRMEQSPDFNPGQTITDASRLGRIRRNMLGNPDYTAQGRQQQDANMIVGEYMYQKKRRDEANAKNNAALEQYRSKLTDSVHSDYLRKGEVDYMRNLSSGGPLSPEAQYYTDVHNARIDGRPAPPLPDQVQKTINQGVENFRGQLAAKQKRVTPAVTPRNPNVMTQKEMEAYSAAHKASLDPYQEAEARYNALDPKIRAEAEARIEAARKGIQPSAVAAPTVNPVTAGQANTAKATTVPVTTSAQPAQASTATPVSTGTPNKQSDPAQTQPNTSTTGQTVSAAVAKPTTPAQPNAAVPTVNPVTAGQANTASGGKSPRRIPSPSLNKSGGINKPLINPFLR